MLLLQLTCCIFYLFYIWVFEIISLWKRVSTFRSKNITIIQAFEGKILAQIIGLLCICYLEHESVSVNIVLKLRHGVCKVLWGSNSLSRASLPLIMEMYLWFSSMHPCLWFISLTTVAPVWRWVCSHFTFLSLRTLLTMNMKSKVLGREQMSQQEGCPWKGL